MRIEADAVLRHPREAVFAAFRDDLPGVAEFMPNVRRIDVLERIVDGPVARLHNVWHGSLELPAPLAQRLEERFLSWDDRAIWDERDYTCAWSIVPHALADAVRCSGQCSFVALDDQRTRYEVTGELTIGFERVPGVPLFLAGSLGRTAESFLVRQIAANLTAVSEALAAYLKDDTIA